MAATPHYLPFFKNDNRGPILVMKPGANREAQNTEFQPLGLTLVGFVRHADLWPIEWACQRLKCARKTFRSFNNRPHMTVQGALGRNQPQLTLQRRDQVIAAVGDAARRVFAGAGPLRVRLTSIQAGRTEGKSDGTVVWLAPWSQNDELMQLAECFRQTLAPKFAELSSLLSLAGDQPGGKWLTLGYFDEASDFPIDEELSDAFNELQYSTAEIWIDQVSLVEFGYKSLADGRVLATIPLRGTTTGVAAMGPKPRVIARSIWPAFRGWSFLFDNPGDSLQRFHDVQLIACKPWDEPALGLYRKLDDGLEAIGLHKTSNPFSFHKVEPSSKHVTVLDGANEENMGEFDEQAQAAAVAMLRDLPFRFGPLPSQLVDPQGFERVLSNERPIRFRFMDLKNWENRTLVARLQPADDCSAEVLQVVARRRQEMDAQFVAHGRKPLASYNPHCTLGYFGDDVAAAATASLIEDWTRIFKEIAAETVIEFASISAYGFSDLATFVKA